MNACPTCGGFWRTAVRFRRGGIRRVKPPRRWSKQREAPGSIRVYWPYAFTVDRGRYAQCPDSWHVTAHRVQVAGVPVDSRLGGQVAYSGVNRHDGEVSARRKAKARRHRALQAKGRR